MIRYFHLSIYQGGCWIVKHSGTLLEMRMYEMDYIRQGYLTKISANI